MLAEKVEKHGTNVWLINTGEDAAWCAAWRLLGGASSQCSKPARLLL
jgi:ATP-dependent phosphoenolpyruvate carboxykinase